MRTIIVSILVALALAWTIFQVDPHEFARVCQCASGDSPSPLPDFDCDPLDGSLGRQPCPSWRLAPSPHVDVFTVGFGT